MSEGHCRWTWCKHNVVIADRVHAAVRGRVAVRYSNIRPSLFPPRQTFRDNSLLDGFIFLFILQTSRSKKYTSLFDRDKTPKMHGRRLLTRASAIPSRETTFLPRRTQLLGLENFGFSYDWCIDALPTTHHRNNRYTGWGNVYFLSGTVRNNSVRGTPLTHNAYKVCVKSCLTSPIELFYFWFPPPTPTIIDGCICADKRQ